MAFDQNLEADRIDGLNLFSAFLRVPLLVLGGILGRDESSKSNDIDCDSLRNDDICVGDVAESTSENMNNNDGQFRVRGTDCKNRSIQLRQPAITTSMNHSIFKDSSESAADHSYHISGIKRTKKMSWSDESGLPLAYENDESISHQEHNNSPYSSVTGGFQKATKSAMRKSISIRHASHELSDHDRNTTRNASRYIPNMNPRTVGNGLIIPTRPYGRPTSVDNKMLGSNGPEMSPQWGWYINTTPPTQELYHNRSTPQSLLSSASPPKLSLIKCDDTNGISQTQSNRPIQSTRDSKSYQNQVFRNLQNSTKTNPMGGWTSIPI